MRGLICPAPGQLDYVDDLPEPGPPPPGWALLDVAEVGICGTDYHIYEGKHPYLSYPRVMGHEVSARVRIAGAGVDLAPGTPVIVNPYLSCGHCIACRKGKPNCCANIQVLGVHRDGAMCERIHVPASNLYPAGTLSLRDGATVEFLAIGAHAVRRSMATPGSRALVIGAGPIGLGTALFARIAGLQVTLLDTSAERLAVARDRLGFDSTLTAGPDLIAQIDASTDGERFDAVFDATGNAASMQGALTFVAQGGVLVFVGVVRDDIAVSHPEFHRREMMLVGSRNAVKADFDHVTASILAGQVPVAALVTHTTTLAQAATDLPLWARQKSGLIKAIIRIG
ncbi:MAG: alcohol dehydrogenase catalytic domain-containing protein [Rhodobacteraceae bacterium]|nr:alcohol dehydrogenase catalytic domain-containing protein [Paracoccaceae bacterium]